MGATYAGILGLLAFTTVIVRNVLASGNFGDSIVQAVMCLAIFAALGHIAGRLAQWITEESVRTKFAADMAKEAQAEKAGA